MEYIKKKQIGGNVIYTVKVQELKKITTMSSVHIFFFFHRNETAINEMIQPY